MNLKTLFTCTVSLLMPLLVSFAQPRCDPRSTDAGVRASCAATNTFYNNHLASTATGAVRVSNGRADRKNLSTNTVIELTSTNVTRLGEAAERAPTTGTARTSKSVTAWTCTYAGTGAARAATCTGPTTMTVYLCARTFSTPASAKQVYHLDTSTTAACN